MIQSLERKNFERPLKLVWAAAFTDIFAFTILNPFMSRFYLDLGASISQVGLLLSVNAAIAFFSGILWGKLSDRFGRKPILLICRLGALAGYVILAFSTNITMALISRIVDGIFSRSILITLTVVGDLVEADQRSHEMSRVGIPWIAGGLVGPAIGGALSGNGLMGPGLFCAGLTLLTFLITLFTFKESNPVLIKPAGQHLPVGEPGMTRHALGLLGQRNPRILLGQNLFAFLAHILFVTTASLFLTERFGLSIAQIGTLLTVIGVITLTVRLLVFPRVLKKFADKKTYTIGLVSFLVAFLWLAFASSLWEFVLIYALVSFGTTCSVDVMHGILSRTVRESEQGQMMGLNSAVESISLVLGPIIGSLMLSLPYSGLYGIAAAISSFIALMIGFVPLALESDHRNA